MHTVVYILGVIFLGIMGITYIDNYMKIQKEKLQKRSPEHNDEFEQELQSLKQQNAELKKRIENLEAIVIEEDMKLMTGLNDMDKEDKGKADNPQNRQRDIEL